MSIETKLDKKMSSPDSCSVPVNAYNDERSAILDYFTEIFTCLTGGGNEEGISIIGLDREN